MRRDFGQLLTAVQAVALCTSANATARPTARSLPPSLTMQCSSVARAGVRYDRDGRHHSGGARDRRVLKSKEAVTRATLAARLQKSPSTIRWRVGKALASGWLVEDKDSHELRHGTPMPAAGQALPPGPASVVKRIDERLPGRPHPPLSCPRPTAQPKGGMCPSRKGFDGSLRPRARRGRRRRGAALLMAPVEALAAWSPASGKPAGPWRDGDLLMVRRGRRPAYLEGRRAGFVDAEAAREAEAISTLQSIFPAPRYSPAPIVGARAGSRSTPTRTAAPSAGSWEQHRRCGSGGPSGGRRRRERPRPSHGRAARGLRPRAAAHRPVGESRGAQARPSARRPGRARALGLARRRSCTTTSSASYRG